MFKKLLPFLLLLSVCMVFSQNKKLPELTAETIQVNRTQFDEFVVAKENPLNRCATSEKMTQYIKENPSYAQTLIEMEKEVAYWIENNSSQKSASVLTIPVVVHVLYRTNTQNISDNQIYEQIDVLNEDFRMLNADAANTPAAFASFSADMEIEFCLASQDPNGNPTDGINRVQTSVQKIGNTSKYYSTSQGGADIWNASYYLNIWVCEIDANTAGFAQLPGGSSSSDGVVIDYRVMGTSGTVSYPYNKGRTATHETGHWLGLYHIWGDDNGACTGSDYVNDTPDQANSSYGCPSYPKTDNCTPSSPGIMFMNFMDYSDDACMNMFTDGQASRVQAIINSYRPKLSSSNGCSGGGTSTLTADFSASSTNIGVGYSVDFTDLSTGSPTNWLWKFSGGAPATSSQQNPTGVVYNTAGTYDVTLIIYDGTSLDTLTETNYITVSASTGLCDTLSNMDANSSATFYSLGSDGYFSGHNSYKDEAFAEYFSSYPSSSDMESAWIWFGVADYSSANSKVAVSVWDNTGTNGGPGTKLASEDVYIKDISSDVSNGYITEVTFSSPITINTGFFVGVELTSYSNGDTVVLVTNALDESSNTGWLRFSGGSWYSYADGWGYDIGFWILPIFCPPGPVTDISEYSENDNLVHLYPNPTNDKITISGLREIYPETIEVYNVLGDRISGNIVSQVSLNSFDVNLTDKENGVYFVRLKTSEGGVIKKILLNK